MQLVQPVGARRGIERRGRRERHERPAGRELAVLAGRVGDPHRRDRRDLAHALQPRGDRRVVEAGRLELLLAEPLSRTTWLLSRTALAACVAIVLALISAVALWIGAAAVGQDVAFGSLVEAGLNCIPLIVLTVGVSVAVLALAPRAVVFVYVPVAIAYLWDALGTAIKAPTWSLDLSPFHVLAAVPAQNFAFLPAAILTVVGLGLVVVGVSAYRGRDLVTA